jgi:beta-lactamase class A
VGSGYSRIHDGGNRSADAFALQPRRAFVLLVCLVLARGLAVSAQAPPPATRGTAAADGENTALALRARVARSLEEIAAGVDGVMGYVVWDPASGERFERMPDVAFPTASSIKLAILYELFKQAEEGRVKLDVPEPMPEAARVGGSGLLVELKAPVLSLRDYATLMVLISDNSATNVLIDRVGMDRVNARMRGLGLKTLQLRRRMIDLEAARRGDENVASPDDLARLLDAIRRGEGLSAESRDGVLAILTRPKSTAMTRSLPPGTRVASKPGGLEGVAADAGVVLLEKRPYVFVAMCAWLNENSAGDAAIARASRVAYDYFSRVGAGGQYGRFIDRR